MPHAPAPGPFDARLPSKRARLAAARLALRTFFKLAPIATALVALASACSSEQEPQRGGVMVMVAEDAPLALDHVRIEVSSPGKALQRIDLQGADVKLPTTLAVASNGSAEASVGVSVSAFRAGVAIDRRDAIVEHVPVDRVAALPILLSARCSAQVETVGSDARSRCVAGLTCNPSDGTCTSWRVDGNALGTYEAGAERAITTSDASTTAPTPTTDGGTSVNETGTTPPAAECLEGTRNCGGICAAFVDPQYGCNPASCSPCSNDPNTLFTCEAGACKLAGCGAGYKSCGGKCVAINDPTYGCGATTCDATTCPSLDGGTGTLVCQNYACVIGDCGPGTKKCGYKCVPPDRNNGCESASCGSCANDQACSGTPSSCTCVPDNAKACQGKQCGEVTNNCGQKVDCGTCASPTSCGGGGISNQCGCAAEPLATTCVSKACGKAVNNCGQTVWCPNLCTDAQTCDVGANTCITPPSCVGLGAGQATCGSSQELCCTNKVVTGGNFNRHNDPSYPASISSFRLDKFEVTVKRFQAFKYAWVTQGWRPAAGSGKHVHLPGGLNGNETGWDTSWVTDSLMSVTASDFDTFLACAPGATWGSATGDLAMNCVSWWEAAAFCIWDGGFLPSAAEWNYAAAGGSSQRDFPWGSYNGGTPWANSCINGSGQCPELGVKRVSEETSTYGVGKYGQVDMSGNVAELTADRPTWTTWSPPSTCTNCAEMGSPLVRLAHGGSYWDWSQYVKSSYETRVTARSERVGFRCARPN